MFDEPRTLILAGVMFTLIMAPLVYFLRAVVQFSRSLELAEEQGIDGGGRLQAPAVDYAMSTVLAAPFEEVLTQARLALREEGFAVVAEIDVADAFDSSGIRFEPYTILVAWDAGTMAQILRSERTAGLLMPARVVVFQVEGGTAVAAMDPRRLLDVAENPNLLPVAVEARAQLQRAIDRLEVGTVTLVSDQ